MSIYGWRKISTRVPGHQRCWICHSHQKNLKKRARRAGKREIQVDLQATKGEA